MSKDRKFDLEDRLIDFAIRIINIAESLPKTKVGNHIAGQLIRSGTSPAPNYGEAQGPESRSDFIHKMKISLKELRETRIWLLMIVKGFKCDCGSLLFRYSIFLVRYSIFILLLRNCSMIAQILITRLARSSYFSEGQNRLRFSRFKQPY